ncbi:hypothetical protein C8R46DRAFT_1285694 [Mycena filopes]|nr:hypothetical protein C8R46DRAFT_1285694 [Mycena filopes]
MQPPPSHLVLSAALTCVAAIPNHAIRYAALGLTAACALIHYYNVHLHSPLMKLHHLIQLIERTAVRIRHATVHCQRHHFFLVEQMLRLLQADHTASRIHCRIVYASAERFSWTKYRLLLKDIAACTERVDAIGIAIEDIIEAERQRQLTDEMNEIRTVLSTAPAAAQTYPPNRRYSTERHRRKGGVILIIGDNFELTSLVAWVCIGRFNGQLAVTRVFATNGVAASGSTFMLNFAPTT